ncbi:response regulator [bacterium]|nr:response regulator [bacterium]
MDHRKILIVDDETMIAEELSEFLESFDFPCSAVNSVDSALALIANDSEITLVMTDMRMPGRDGADLLRELSALPGREFEYVVISGHLDAEKELKDLSSASITLMRKPINIDEMLTFLNSLTFVQ